MVCSYCHQNGHYRPTCPLKKAHQQQQQQPQEPEPVEEPVEPAQEPEPIQRLERIQRIERIPRPRPRRPTEAPPNGSDPLPLPIQWNEEIKAAFVHDVQSDPITTNWYALANKYQRTPESLKETYRRLVDPLEHIDLVASVFDTTTALDTILQQHAHICTACHTQQYSPLQYWQSDGFCEACHARMFEEEIAKRWRQVRQYAEETGKAECEFCRKPSTALPSTIQQRIQTGHPLFEVLQEVDHAHTVCDSCQVIVRKVERIAGYHYATLEERIKWEEHMIPIYEALKKRLARQ